MACFGLAGLGLTWPDLAPQLSQDQHAVKVQAAYRGHAWRKRGGSLLRQQLLGTMSKDRTPLW